MKHRMTGLLLGLLGLVLAGCSSGDGAISQAGNSPTASLTADGTVTVYYFHRSLRCISCLTIERMARNALAETYPLELTQGAIRWQPVDYWQDAAFAKRFGVDSPTLVVTVTKAGKIASYHRLDETWALKGNPRAFRDMLLAAVNEAIQKSPAQPGATEPL